MWFGVLFSNPLRVGATIVGGLPSPLTRGRTPPLSPRMELPSIPANDPHLPAPLCKSPRGDGAGSTAASNLSPVPSPLSSPPLSPPELSVLFIEIILFSLSSSSSSLRSKSQLFIPRTTNCSPLIKKSALSVASHVPL